MAKGNAKKRAEENIARLSLLRKVVLGAVVSHAAIRLAWFRASAIWRVH